MDLIKRVPDFIKINFLVLIFTIWMIIKQLFQIAKYRSQYFRIEKRKNRPSLLLDTRIGIHHFALLKSKIKLHYVANGNPGNPLMLFVHGFPECWLTWKNQLQFFGIRGYYAVALDLRGYGDSDKPSGIKNYAIDILINDLLEFLVAINKPRIAILVGHDWGGYISYSFAAYYPSLIDKLIILNAPHPIHFTDVVETNFDQVLKSWYIFFFQCKSLPEYFCKTNDFKLLQDILERSLDNEVIDCYKFYLSKPGAMTPPINYYRANIDTMLVKSFPLVTKTPTMVIWGQDDLALVTEQAECGKYFADFKIELIQGSHFIQNDNPEKVNQLITNFILFQ